MFYFQEVEIFRVILLGEEDRGDPQKYQAFCFVIFLDGNDYISTDAMSKLRQVSWLYPGMHLIVYEVIMVLRCLLIWQI